MNAKDVKRIRAKLGLSQSEFADLLGLSVRAVQDWEIDRNKPGAPATALLKLADSGVLKIKTISMRDIESSAKARRDGIAKDQLSRDIPAPIRGTGKPKVK